MSENRASIAILGILSGAAVALLIRTGGIQITGLPSVSSLVVVAGFVAAALVVARRAPGTGVGGPASWLSLGRVRLTGHAHGGRAKIARHEAGHTVVAKALGGKIHSVTVGSDSGYTDVTLPNHDPVHAIAFLRAGRYATGTGRGCSGDEARIRQILRREVPARDRARVMREGDRLARKTIAAKRGEIRRLADRLNEKGRL